MDPVVPAAVPLVTALGIKVAEGTASAAGKAIWERVQKLFNWSATPPVAEIKQATEQHLQKNPTHAAEAINLIQQDAGLLGTLVGRIDAQKVVVAQNIDKINM